MIVNRSMATAAERNQILLHITAQGASPFDVVNLEMLRASATLAPPAIALEHPSSKVFVRSWF